jgi:ABC-type phosphate/phosphonate transport system ATPase subunit
MVRVIVSTLSRIEVTESDGSSSQTRHKINMDKQYYQKISNGIIGQKDFVEKSFEFFSKKDKDSIMRQFNIKEIREYFPEYETEIIKAIRET